LVVPDHAATTAPTGGLSPLDDPLVAATNALPASTLTPLGKSSSSRNNFNPTTIVAIAAAGAAAVLLLVVSLMLLDRSTSNVTTTDRSPRTERPRYQPAIPNNDAPAGPKWSAPPAGTRPPATGTSSSEKPAGDAKDVSDEPLATTPPDDPALEAALDAWMRGSSFGGGVVRVADERSVVSQYSWMTRLLPHMGYEELFNEIRFEKSWTHQDNVQLATAIIPEFLNPNDSRDRWTGAPMQGVALTHFVGVSGIDDRHEIAATLERTDPRAGVFGYEEVVRPEDIKDGASNSVSIVGAGELNGPWIAGGGATVRGAREPFFDELTGFGTKGPKRGTVAHFADGSTRFISADIDPEVFRALCTVGGGESVSPEQAGEHLDFFPTKKRP
jgi:hypothetical protein